MTGHKGGSESGRTHAEDNHQPATKWQNASNVFSAKEEILPCRPRLPEDIRNGGSPPVTPLLDGRCGTACSESKGTAQDWPTVELQTDSQPDSAEFSIAGLKPSAGINQAHIQAKPLWRYRSHPSNSRQPIEKPREL